MERAPFVDRWYSANHNEEVSSKEKRTDGDYKNGDVVNFVFLVSESH